MIAAIPVFQGIASPRPGCLTFLAALAAGLTLFAAPLPAQFVYAGNQATTSLYGYSIGSSGSLAPLPGSPFPTGSPYSNPGYVSVDPNGKFVYVTNGGVTSISIYSIGSNGALTLTPSSPVPLPYPGPLAVDPTGKFLYVATPTMTFPIGGEVLGYSISSDGSLTPVPGSPFAAGAFPSSIVADPAGQFVYVVNNNGGSISAYSIGSNGTLTAVPGSPFTVGSVPSAVTIDPAGRFVYVAGGGTSGVVWGYSIGANGALTSVPGSPFAAGKLAGSLAIDPSSRFVYVTNLVDSTISAYSINSSGALTPISGSPFAAGKEPYSIATDPTDKFVYVANESDNTVSAYSIAATGALTPVPNSPFATGTAPVSVAVSPYVPFAVSSAKLTVDSTASTFTLRDSFTLGANTNGISPDKENVTMQIGSYSVTVPTGSFKKRSTGKFVFHGTINGVSLNLQIVPLGSNAFTFIANGAGSALVVTDPVPIVLTIGIDSGATTVAHYRN